MKKYLILLLSALFTQQVLTQDIIILKNGEESKVLVTEVGPELIKYKKHANPEGPTYSVEKYKVFMIRYENGTKDVFTEEQKTQVPETIGSSNQDPRYTSSELPKGSFNINPLGLLQFGPIFQIEAKLGERLYLAPHFRYAFAGVLTHLVWTEFAEDSELSPGTAAIGGGLKGFAQNSGNTWYYAGILDVAWAKATYDKSETYGTEEKATSLAMLGNSGYRWRFSRGTYLNVGIFAGLSFDLKAEERYILTGQLVDSDKETTFFAMFELSFGWDFGH